MAAVAQEKQACGYCGSSPEGTNPRDKLLQCSRCKVVVYCSRTCQKEHWRNGHKGACQQAADEAQDAGQKPAKKTVDKQPSKPLARPVSDTDKTKPKAPMSRGATAAKKPKPTPRVASARGDVTGAPLSFGKDDNCAICLDTMRNPTHLPCGHWYCKECVEGLRQAASAQDLCPMCREPLPPGADKLHDEAWQKWKRITRQVESRGRRRAWAKLAPKQQHGMDEVRGLLEQAAAQQHILAQRNLAEMYLNGEGVSQNWRSAKRWLECAACQGDAIAQYKLGALHHNGDGGAPVNLAEARNWYEQAGAQGVAWAQHYLGNMCAAGEGGPRDHAQAKYWWEQAAAQGDETAMANVGSLYANGWGVEQNFNEAMRWYYDAKAGGYNAGRLNNMIETVMEERKRHSMKPNAEATSGNHQTAT